ncbi:MAG: flippase-like domain-containing protein [Saprospiraceae bacterium]|nr:flippase-like domain-containing protein [Saprospiraceae bacterium]
MISYTFPSWLKWTLKLLISLAIIFFIAEKISWSEFFSILSEANPYWLILAILFFTMSKLISAERFRELVRLHFPQFDVKQNLHLYWKSMYYNLLLPGGISGDAYKMKVLRDRFSLSIGQLIKLVLADRISGLIALLQWALLLMMLLSEFRIYFIWILSAFLLSLMIAWIFLKFINPLYLVIRKRLALFSAMVQLMQLISALAIIYALHQQEHLGAYLLLFLGSSLAAMIPVTIGGAGAREICFMYGAPLVGGVVEEAIAVGFVFYLISTAVSLTGMILSFKRNKTDEISVS